MVGGERFARPPLAPCDRLFEIYRRVDRRRSCQPLDPCRYALLRPPEMRQEDQGLDVDLLEQQRTARKHLREGLLDNRFLHLQQLRRRKLELCQRQSAVSVRGRFRQDMVDARPRPVERVSGNPNLLGDLIGGREADPVDVFRQRVRIAPHLLDCLLAVGLEDSHRPAFAPYTTERTTWFKIKNRSYSQMAGREELFERERHKEPVPGWHSCELACAEAENALSD